MARNRTLSRAELRKRSEHRAGIALMIATALAFSGMLYGAYQADKARGVTVSESLASAGL